MSGQPRAAGRTRLRRRAFLAAALALVLGLGIAAARLLPRLAPHPDDTSTAPAGPTDPRLAYDGPHHNIHPDVRYVGDAACAACHEAIAHSFARHPMGRSLCPIQALPQPQPTTPETNNPFTFLGRRFQVERQGTRQRQRQAALDASGQPVVELSLDVGWVIGSGAKGYSYLSENGGYLFQTPISWYTQKKRWDLSPGFGPEVLSGRLVEASCLFCHANGLHQDPEQPDHFLPPVFIGQSIGCERCHGPGELHARTSDRWDIVNPARLAPQLRDAVCEQCHLEGEARVLRAGRKLFDYRPGLPLHDFWAVLVHDPRDRSGARAVSHVEQMYQSKCFSRPVGGVQLGCATCHDPHVHVGPAQRQAYYRPRCLKCHDEAKGQQGCSEPLARRKQQSPQDSCIDCHMPRYHGWDVAHTASTDHRIVRRPAAPQVPAADRVNAVLVDFYQDRFPGGDPQGERSLGLGLVKAMDASLLSPRRQGDRALRLLELALANDPTDSSVREGKVEAYLLLKRPGEALSEAELLLAQGQQSWQLLIQAAYAAEAEGQNDRARDYWRRAVDNGPPLPKYLLHLVRLLIEAGQHDEARGYCEQLLRVDPFNVSGRQAWVGLLLEQGRQAEAQRAFDVIRKLAPPDLPQREEWFRKQMR